MMGPLSWHLTQGKLLVAMAVGVIQNAGFPRPLDGAFTLPSWLKFSAP